MISSSHRRPRAQERRKVVRDIVVKERRIRGVALKLEAEKKIREAMNRLIPHAPKWKAWPNSSSSGL